MSQAAAARFGGERCEPCPSMRDTESWSDGPLVPLLVHCGCDIPVFSTPPPSRRWWFESHVASSPAQVLGQ